MLENIKKVDKKVLIMFSVVLVVIIALIIIFIFMSLSGGGKLSYEKIENKMVSAAEKYYKDNQDSLPKEIGDTVEIEASTLVSAGLMKDLSEYTEESVSCGGKVIVGKGVYDYDYVASLDCGDAYKTQFLADVITEKTVTSGNGLYKMEDVVKLGSGSGLTIDEDGYDLSSNELMEGYIYRGENVDNFVQIDGQLFRIIKIDGNKDFTLMQKNKTYTESFDSNVNSDTGENDGINDYTVLSGAYGELSKIVKELDKEGILLNKVATKNICIGARSIDDVATDGSIECSKVLKKQYFGLLPIYDVMNASLSDQCATTVSRECTNYNYLTIYSTYWSITPNIENSYTGYRVSQDGIVSSKLTRTAYYRYVIYASNRLVYVSGSGTESDPYIVK